MKRLVLVVSTLLFCFAPLANAESSLFKNIKEKVSSSTQYLVNNAWNIAGSFCLAGSVGLAAAFGYRQGVCSYPLEDTARVMIIPGAFFIGSLVCFNCAERIKKQDEIAKNKIQNHTLIKESLETIKNDVTLLQARIVSQTIVQNMVKIENTRRNEHLAQELRMISDKIGRIKKSKKDAEQYSHAEEIRNHDNMLRLLVTKFDHIKLKLESKDYNIAAIEDDLKLIRVNLADLQEESEQYLSKISNTASYEKVKE